MNAIQVIAENTYFVQARGQRITVQKNPETMTIPWSVFVDNASARVWNRGLSSSKWFNSLEEIEAQYKSLRGLCAVHNALSA